ncbi:MAG: SIS domain-containing protein [Pseudomonadota bacterium]|nr:sugar isomerase [Rhodospirillaceae bacterium]MBO21047.1 sugar isomerase [Rhodospirillaceae bacterium]MEE2721576.1 SIS domain-containing protein [Pseudomonadota bacterium]|tara:strand:+ start:1268 stop:1897 length:630 start_codon:yes stop_codon:yes gene_type:complete
MNKIDELTQKHISDPAGYARSYLRYLASCLDTIDCGEIERFIDLLLEARRQGRTVFFIGNGGSAATASHFANDISIGTRTGDDRPFRAVSLTDNVAVMTAVANDEGYDRMFVDQLRVHMRDGDSVVAISASGNSPNVISAVDYAKDRGATVVGLTGFDGGDLRKKSDISLHIQTEKGEYGPVEDIHMIFDHLIGSYLIATVKQEAGKHA